MFFLVDTHQYKYTEKEEKKKFQQAQNLLEIPASNEV